MSSFMNQSHYQPYTASDESQIDRRATHLFIKENICFIDFEEHNNWQTEQRQEGRGRWQSAKKWQPDGP